MVSAMLILGAVATLPAGVAPTSLCVGGSGCHASVQEAVDAAHDDDTIHINPGTYAPSGDVVIIGYHGCRWADADAEAVRRL